MNRILFVHGRSFKPQKRSLQRMWYGALRSGLLRSHPSRVDAFDAAKKDFAYYGDLSNAFLRTQGKTYSEVNDAADRWDTLAKLKQLSSKDFTKKRYNALPGKTSLKETFADVGAGPLRWFGLSESAIAAVAPDMGEYWNPDSSFGGEVRWRFTQVLRRAFDSGDRLLVIAHSLGTLIAWDNFWKFSYYGEYEKYRKHRVNLFITLGSPLGDETVKDHLKGSRATGDRRFAANIVRWENIAAEDDYISHDQRVANDFKAMVKGSLPTRKIHDHRIYNVAVRHGSSNPHTSVGYLIHPTTVGLIAAWL